MLACVRVIALAACGGDEEETTALGSALAYLPKETPFAVAIDTNLDSDQYKSVDSILAKFPLDAPSLKDLLRDSSAAKARTSTSRRTSSRSSATRSWSAPRT